MRPNTIVVVGAIAVIAAVGLVPREGPDLMGADGAAASAGTVDAGRSTSPPSHAAPGVGRQLIEEYLATEIDDPPSTAADRTILEVLIATVPDPVESGLDWAYDAVTAALRSALERAGFVLDRTSLPWYDDSGRLITNPGDSRPWRTQPGALLFRHSRPGRRELVLILVVGESATSGVARDAFRRALDERVELFRSQRLAARGDRRVVRIVGPTFSGSSRSLRVTLDGFLDNQGEARPRVLILSGAATSLSNVEELTDHPPEENDCRLTGGLPPEGVTFCATVHPDPDLRRAFATSLRAMYPHRRNLKVMSFHEATTSYGQQVAGSAGARGEVEQRRSTTNPPGDAEQLSARVVNEIPFPFPMAISALRVAGKSPTPAAGSTLPGLWETRDVRTQLALNEAQASADPPEPASALNPAYLEVVLNSMVRAARLERPLMAGILATDVRDKIFLASVLRQELPDLRLFTFESNLLYLWPRFARSMRGMLVFTTYPLSPDSQAWTRAVRRIGEPQEPPLDHPGVLHFLMEGAEGVFNATLLHLGSQLLIEYRYPLALPSSRSALESPPVWVTAVGRDRLVPLRVFEAGAEEAAGYVARVPAYEIPEEVQAPLGRGSLVVLLGLGAFGFLIAWSWLRELRGGANQPADSSRRLSLLLQEEMCTAGVLIVVACMVLPLPLLCLGILMPGSGMPLPLGPYLRWAYLSYWSGLAAAALTGLVAAAVGCAALTRVALIGFRHRSALGPASRLRSVSRGGGARWQGVLDLVAHLSVFAVALCCLVLFVKLVWLARRLGGEPRGQMEVFLHRLVTLDSGLSVVVPLMLVGGILLTVFMWGMWHVRSLRSELAVELCLSPVKEPGLNAFFNRVDELNDRLLYLIPDRGTLATLIGAFVTAYFLWNAFDPTFESIAFAPLTDSRPLDHLLRVGVLSGLVAIAWFGYRFYSVWSAFSSTLSALGGRPVAAAFEHVEAVLRRPMFPWAARRRLLTSTVDPLSSRALFQLGAEAPPGSDLARRLQTAGLTHEGGMEPRPAFPSTQERLAHVLVGVLATLAVTGAFRRLPRAKPASGTDGKATDKERSGAEAFFASQVVAFCQKVLRQLWMLAAAAFTTWILMSLLVSSYPQLAPSSVSALLGTELGALVVVFLAATFQMSRDPVLSAMSGSAVGQFSFDADTRFRLIMFVITPFLTLLGSETPVVRKIVGTSFFELLKLLTR